MVRAIWTAASTSRLGLFRASPAVPASVRSSSAARRIRTRSRLYAGGGGSVRGLATKSWARGNRGETGRFDPDKPKLRPATLAVRWCRGLVDSRSRPLRFSDYGIVPVLDSGQCTRSSTRPCPPFCRGRHRGRLYTNFGPRARAWRPPSVAANRGLWVTVYVSIGQAF